MPGIRTADGALDPLACSAISRAFLESSARSGCPRRARDALATSGSGDTLAGLIGGLAARGLPPVAACAWGVVAHASTGAALARSHGPWGISRGNWPASCRPGCTRSARAVSPDDRRALPADRAGVSS
ncbi:NAD(P)H-hydrate dehydratase [Variovorax sp. J22R24]|nr:NAD(P)H-hydrate dehydratase [Variovorax sp. J22R24]MDM0109605.1 NAD(P)H-hydrate dehydratase [Variovorax sp. J22R24]